MPLVLWGLVPFVPLVGLGVYAAAREPTSTAGLDPGIPKQVARAARQAVLVETDPAMRAAFSQVLGTTHYPRAAAYVARAPGAAMRTAHVGAAIGAVDYASFQTDPAVPPDLKGWLSAAATPDGTAAIQSEGLSGIQAVAGGAAMSPTEIQGGFALASAGALALASGMSLSAAMPVMLPIAAVVFGGGLAISALLRSVFGISDANTSQVYACSPNDSTNGTSPSDPRWKRAYSPSLYDGYGQGRPANWAPATQGKFETWARPILMRADDGYLNCVPPPGVSQISPDDLQKAAASGNLSGVGKLSDSYEALWQMGAVKAWNDLNAGSPTRPVALDATIPYGDPRGQDPIQKMLWRFRRTLKEFASEYASGAPISIEVADPSPSKLKFVNLRSAVRAAAAAPSGYGGWNLAQWVSHYLPGVAVAVSD